MANIMKKRFYLVIGWENIELQSLSLVDRLLNRGNSVSLLKISEKEFKARGDELREKAAVVASGLGSIGLHCKQLSTRELIELFYNFYNPGIADKERLADLENLQVNIVSRKDTGQFDLQKPHNTTEETPVIDNTAYVKEQDKMKKRAEAAEKAQAVQAPAQAKTDQRPAAAAPTQPTAASNVQTPPPESTQTQQSNSKNQNSNISSNF